MPDIGCPETFALKKLSMVLRFNSLEQPYFGWGVRAMFGACLSFAYLAGTTGLASDSSICPAMVNNVFLAYLPVEISLHLHRIRRAFVFWGMVFVWMIFYPNAPYVLTDYFHLAYVDPYTLSANSRILRPDMRLWLTFTVLSVSAVISAMLGTWSLDHMAGLLQRRLRRPEALWRFSIVLVFVTFSSAGIYLGRFARIHSVHLFTRPHHALDEMSSSIGVNMVEFIVLVSFIQLVLWACLKFLAASHYKNGGGEWGLDRY